MYWRSSWSTPGDWWVPTTAPALKPSRDSVCRLRCWMLTDRKLNIQQISICLFFLSLSIVLFVLFPPIDCACSYTGEQTNARCESDVTMRTSLNEWPWYTHKHTHTLSPPPPHTHSCCSFPRWTVMTATWCERKTYDSVPRYCQHLAVVPWRQEERGGWRRGRMEAVEQRREMPVPSDLNFPSANRSLPGFLFPV